MEKSKIQGEQSILTSESFLKHWQDHRRLTRKVIQKFPEDKLFSFSIGGMRPFSELAKEMIEMAGSGIHGVVTGKWVKYSDLEQYARNQEPKSKNELLTLWNEITVQIDTLWPKIPFGRFEEVDVAFGQYEGTITSFIFYFIDNEVHHRGQGYVYLRALGITPPLFWERD